MPNVEEDTKLDFKDVLLRPKRSKIKSRADVSLNPIFEWSGRSDLDYNIKKPPLNFNF